MSARQAALICLLLPGSVLVGQTDPPVFSPPPGQTSRPATDQERPASRPERPETQEEGIERLFRTLTDWPGRKARDAAVLLAGLGPRVKDRLLLGLTDNDWRVRAGCAFALGEMRDADAVPDLVAAIQDPSNRAGLAELLEAVVRIDPVRGTAAVLPFVTHTSTRIRRDAMRALPPVVAEEHLPSVLAIFRHQSGKVRRRALELLTRIPGAEERPEFFKALSDPEPQVAAFAARHLGGRTSAGVRSRLKELARTAALRQATYALLALVHDEDLSGHVHIRGDGPLRERAQQMLGVKDHFYQGAAAVVLSNVSYRSTDPVLRKLADKYLVSLLLGTVAGGVFFSDYTSLEHLCFEKLELLTGQTFGRDALRWKRWWRTNRHDFVARRELRSLTEDDLARCEVTYHHARLDGQESHVVFTGDASRLGETGVAAPLVLGSDDLARLRAELERTDFFSDRGETRDPERVDGFVSIEVRVGPSVFRRFHHGVPPVELLPLVDLLEATERRLAWQRFLLAGDEGEGRRAFLQRQREFFEQTEDPGARRERLLDLALSSYPRLGRAGRALAVRLFRRDAGRAWVAANSHRLAGLLRLEKRLNDQAVRIVELISGEPDPELRSAVLDAVCAAAPGRGEDVLDTYLGRQPMAVVVRLMNDERARVRAAAALNLRRFHEHGEVVDLLIGGLKDYAPEVRNACIQSLASLEDERVLSMLLTVLEGDDEPLKVRAIGALARVGGDQAVPRLMDIYHRGDEARRWAVIRALGEAGGRRAINALAAVVRETGPLELRREALERLRRVEGSDVGERLSELLTRVPEPGLRTLLLDALADVLGEPAIPDVLPYLDDEDPDVARAAALVLGRLGDRRALPRLLALMEPVEGDAAAERAFQELTFHVAEGRTAPERLRAARTFVERFGELSRNEWFLLAASRASVELDGSVDWLDPHELSRAQVLTLLELLVKGEPPLRMHADRVLLRLSGLALEPLERRATPDDVRNRVAVLRGWARRALGGR